MELRVYLQASANYDKVRSVTPLDVVILKCYAILDSLNAPKNFVTQDLFDVKVNRYFFFNNTCPIERPVTLGYMLRVLEKGNEVAYDDSPIRMSGLGDSAFVRIDPLFFEDLKVVKKYTLELTAWVPTNAST
jgi:hypothetical protein